MIRRLREFIPVRPGEYAITALMVAAIIAIAVRGRYREIAIRRVEGGTRTAILAQLLIFSALCNNYSVPTKAVERVQDALAVRLASLRLPAP